MQAIAVGDAKSLSQANGVGPKLASKIIVELRGSLDADTLQNISLTSKKRIPESHFSDDDLSIIQSLVGMGYDRKTVENLIPTIPANLTGVGDRTVWAIRNLHGR